MNPLLWQEVVVYVRDETDVDTTEQELRWTVSGSVADEEAARAQVEQLLLPDPARHHRTNRFIYMEFVDLDGDGVPDGIKCTLLGPKGEVVEPPVPTIQKLRRAK